MPILQRWMHWTAAVERFNPSGVTRSRSTSLKTRPAKNFLGNGGRRRESSEERTLGPYPSFLCDEQRQYMYKNSQRGHKFFYYWLPVIAYCLLIFIQSSLPSSDKIPAFPHVDKLLHVGGYAVLGFLFFRALHSLNNIDSLTTLIILSSVLATLYGLSDEIHQHFVPSRYADVSDVVADSVGGAIGAFSGRFLISRHSQRRH
jgi:VanZ family protein